MGAPFKRQDQPRRPRFEARLGAIWCPQVPSGDAQPGMFGISGTGLAVGRSVTTITDDYPGERPWHFHGGTLRLVAVDVSGEPYVDLEREAEAMLMRE